MKLRAFHIAVACTLCAGCTDRARPLPSELPITFNLNVEIVAPASATFVVPGRTINVFVRGSEPGSRLTGLAFAARRFDNDALVDSARITFAARQDTTAQFLLHVPAGLQTNTQINIYGIAMGPNQQQRVSIPRALLVLSCPTNPAC